MGVAVTSRARDEYLGFSARGRTQTQSGGARVAASNDGMEATTQRQLNTVLCALWAETGEAGKLEAALQHISDAGGDADANSDGDADGGDAAAAAAAAAAARSGAAAGATAAVDEDVLAPVLTREGRFHALALMLSRGAAVARWGGCKVLRTRFDPRA